MAASGCSAVNSRAIGLKNGSAISDADEAVDQIADRQAAARRIAAHSGLDQRIDGAAEIGAEHQRQRRRLRDELRIGKRHHQQHDGDAGMRRPGQRRGDEDAQHRIVGDGAKQRPHRRRLFGRRQRVEQDVQRQQNKSEPDGDAAERAGEAVAADAEGDEADDEQHRRDRRYVEGQILNDQRGADIGAEHDGKRGYQADHAVGRKRGGHQPGRGARLQQRGQAEPGAEGGEAIAQRLAKNAAQIGTERAQHAAEHHVQAPQQQRHAAHQIKQNDRSHRKSSLPAHQRAFAADEPTRM